MGCRVLQSDNYRITCGFNEHQKRAKGKSHIFGCDIVTQDYGTCNIVAHSDGIVRKVVDYVRGQGELDKNGMGYGNRVVIEHSNKVCTMYCHMMYGTITVKEGQLVKRGQTIGYMGSTGNSTGSHLDFSVFILKEKWSNSINLVTDIDTKFEYLNPEKYLDADLPMQVDMVKKEYIDLIGNKAVNRYQKEKVLPSLAICMAALEQGWGKNELATNANNHFSLNNYHDSITDKYGVYRKNAPQEHDGKVTYSVEEFCYFNNLDECLDCYYDWLRRPKKAYADIHNCTDPYNNFALIKQAGYATDSAYTQKLTRIYDEFKDLIKPYDDTVLTEKTIYRVQIGSFEDKNNAIKFAKKAKASGFSVCIKNFSKYFRVQVGAFEVKANAEAYKAEVSKTYPGAYVTTEGGTDVGGWS